MTSFAILPCVWGKESRSWNADVSLLQKRVRVMQVLSGRVLSQCVVMVLILMKIEESVLPWRRRRGDGTRLLV